MKEIFISGSKGFFLGSWVLDGYILRSPPVAAFLADFNSFSCPTVGGLKRPNATVSVSLVSPSTGSWVADVFGFTSWGSACGFASGFGAADDLPTAPFGWSFLPSISPLL